MAREIAPLVDRMIARMAERGCAVEPGSRPRDALHAVPRHLFLPGLPFEQVYAGEAIVTRHGPDGLPISSCSEPAIVVTMLRQLDPQPGDRVLEIGAGTGWNAALLAFLVGESGAVTTIDLDEDIVCNARANLHAAGFGRVRVVEGDGWLGHPGGAPYDRIEATVGVWDLSSRWIAQLREGGVLVVPLWLRAGIQASVAFRRDGAHLKSVSIEPCGFMRLRGPHAGPEGYVIVGGWSAALDAPAPEAVSVLRDLLGSTPGAETLPDLPHGWLMRVLLTEPGAITLSDRPTRWAAGLFDPASRSLALVDGDRLLRFGDEAAVRRLREHVASARPIAVRDLEITASPDVGAAARPGAWVLRRPTFTFTLRERSP